MWDFSTDGQMDTGKRPQWWEIKAIKWHGHGWREGEWGIARGNGWCLAGEREGLNHVWNNRVHDRWGHGWADAWIGWIDGGIKMKDKGRWCRDVWTWMKGMTEGCIDWWMEGGISREGKGGRLCINVLRYGVNNAWMVKEMEGCIQTGRDGDGGLMYVCMYDVRGK